MMMSELDLSHLEHVTLIADTSESAVGHWGVIRSAALALYRALSGRCTVEIYLLGGGQPIDAPALAEMGQPTAGMRPCSLVAPTLRAVLRRWRRTQAAILIGNGEIFDLADWTRHTAIERWALVQAGPDRLQQQTTIPEVPSQHLQRVLALLALPAERRSWRYTAPDIRVIDRSYRWRLDPAGYPMIWIAALNAFMHLFPVTKVQFERFLGAGGASAFGDAWYARLLSLNTRRATGEDIADERLFITGIMPEETGHFGRWLGPGYNLPTVEQWQLCHQWLATQPYSAIGAAIEQEIAPDAARLWEQIEAARRPRTLRDLSLMDDGVVEWATEAGSLGVRSVGMGQGQPGFGPQLLRRPIDPLRPIARRIPVRHGYIGFRMLDGAS